MKKNLPLHLITYLFRSPYLKRHKKIGIAFRPIPLKGMKMIGLVTMVTLVFFSTSVFAQAPAWQWAHSNGGNQQSYSYGLSNDMDGNVYLAAGFNGSSITLGDSTFINTSGGLLALLIKYDPQGNIIWARNARGYNTGHINPTINEIPGGVSTDRFGNIYMTGAFTGAAAVFGYDTLFNSNPIQYDIFLVKYDSSGNVLWAKSAEAANGANATAVTTDGAGSAYITGFFNYSILFGNTTLFTGSSSAFAVKYDTAGNVVWARSPAFNENALVEGYGIAADSIGNVYVTGYFQNDSLVFDDIIIYNPSPYGNNNAFTVAYDTGGHAIWADAPNGSNNSNAKSYGVAVDNKGNTYITGTFTGTYIVFGTDTVSAALNFGDDIFIVKYDAQGNVGRAQGAEMHNGDQFGGLAINIDQQGNIYVLGSNSNSPELVFGADSISMGGPFILASFFIVKFDTTGMPVWMNAEDLNINSQGGPTPVAMTVDNTGAIYVAGYIEASSALLGNDTIMAPSGDVYFFIGKLDTSSSTGTGLTTIKESTGQISVFPNPSTGIYTISGIPPGTRLTVTDAIGRQILVRNFNSEVTTQVGLTNAESGLYFFQFTSDIGSTTQKVILSRVK